MDKPGQLEALGEELVEERFSSLRGVRVELGAAVVEGVGVELVGVRGRPQECVIVVGQAFDEPGDVGLAAGVGR